MTMTRTNGRTRMTSRSSEISKEYLESMQDAAKYLDHCIKELSGEDTDFFSTLLDARLLIIKGVEK